MRGMGQALAHAFPAAAVVAVVLAELNFHVAYLKSALTAWQANTQVAPAATCLVGFAKGASLALSAVSGGDLVAGRVIAIAGYWHTPLESEHDIHPDTTLHLIHGKLDTVLPYRQALLAAEHAIKLKADVTCDVLPLSGHALSDEIIALSLEKLRAYVPKRMWDEALRAAAGQS